MAGEILPKMLKFLVPANGGSEMVRQYQCRLYTNMYNINIPQPKISRMWPKRMHSVAPKSRPSQEPPTTLSLDHARGSWPAEQWHAMAMFFKGNCPVFLQDLSTNIGSEAMETPWTEKPVELQHFAGHLIVAVHREWTSGFGWNKVPRGKSNNVKGSGGAQFVDTKLDVVQN